MLDFEAEKIVGIVIQTFSFHGADWDDKNNDTLVLLETLKKRGEVSGGSHIARDNVISFTLTLEDDVLRANLLWKYGFDYETYNYNVDFFVIDLKKPLYKCPGLGFLIEVEKGVYLNTLSNDFFAEEDFNFFNII